jgi:hypothetical protein
MKRKIQKPYLWLLIVIVLIITTTIVIAAYTGPDPSLRVRTVMVENCHTEKELTSCYYSATVSNGTTCKLGPQTPPCSQPASWEWLAYCGYDRTGSVQYLPVYTDKEVCVDVPTDKQYDNATVSGSINCTNLNGWCTNTASLNISGNEPIPGENITAIEGTGFSVGGSSTSRSISTNGSTVIEYWAVSSVGDTSLKGSSTVKVDTLAPTASVNSPSGWNTGATTITNTSSDGQSGIQTTSIIVSGDFTSSCSGASCSVTVPSSVTGSINWNVYAQDNVNLTNNASGSYNVDNTLPVVSCSASAADGQNGWYVTNPSISISASDAHSGLASTSSSFSSSEGTGISATCYATDNVGLTNSTNIGTFNIDKTAPNGTINTPVDGATITSSTNFVGSASDTVSGFQQVNLIINGKNVGSSSNTNWSISFNPSNYSNGTLTITFQFIDNAGNVSSQSRNIVINNPAPKAALAPERMPINGIVERIDRVNNYIIVNGTRFDLTSSSKLVGTINVGTHVTGYALNYHDDTYADVMELYAQMDIVNISGVVTDITSSTITIDGKVYDVTSSSRIPSGLAIGDTVVGTAQPSWFVKNDAIVTLTIIPPTATITPTFTQVIMPNTGGNDSSRKSPTETPTPTEDPYKYISLDGTEYKVMKSDYEDYELGLITLDELLGIENPNISEQRDDNLGNIIIWSLSILALLGLLILLLVGFGSVVGKVDVSTPKKNSMKLILEDESSREFIYGKKFAILIPTLNNLNAKVWYFFNRVIKIEKL